MATKVLRQKLPPNMRSDFWNDFIDAIEEESELVKDHIKIKRYLYDIDNMDYNRLLEVADQLNIPFNVAVINTTDFLRSEIKSVPFRIKNKATSKLYKSFFQAIERNGQLFLYYWDGANLVRDSYNLLSNINGNNPQKPQIHLSKMQFSTFLSEPTLLDTGLKLDESWKLDSQTSKQNTKHLAMEIVLDKFFFGETVGLAPSENLAPSNLLAPIDQVTYLLDPDYFSYLETNMEVSKKVTEVIHIGCQLTAIADNSRFFNSLGFIYTMPDILLNTVTTDNISAISSVGDIKYMVFGTGTNNSLPSSLGGGSQPSALVTPVARVNIVEGEKWENLDYYGVSGSYIGCLINDVIIGTGDGSTTAFSYTLPHFPVKRGNVKVTFTSGLEKHTIEDDYFGNMKSDYGIGSINYLNGEISIETNFYNDAQEIIDAGDGVTLNFSGTLTNVPIQTGSVIISYIINGTTIVATDNGLGVLTGPQCTGTINYVTGDWALTFSTAPANNTNIVAKYKKQTIFIPDNSTPIEIEYYFLDKAIEITEAGILDANKNLLAYATFPKINFNTFNNHLSMNFIIKKSNFS